MTVRKFQEDIVLHLNNYLKGAVTLFRTNIHLYIL